MLTNIPRLTKILDDDLIGFITAVDEEGQPQTSPVWFVRDGEDLIVYNRADTQRLASIATNSKVSFNLRGDRRADGVVTMEGTAGRADELPLAKDFPGYLDKYGREIERLGWTPDSYSDDFSAAIRVVVTRVRSWGLHVLDS